jgi:hypothetical protein
VCNLHFSYSAFISTSGRAKLHPSAVPLEFKVSASLESTRTSSDSLIFQTNGLKLLNTEKSFRMESPTSQADSDRIHDFESFANDYEDKTPAAIRENWNQFKVVVDQNMRVVVFSSDTAADSPELDWILPNSQKLEKWSQLHCILEHYAAESPIKGKPNAFHFVKQALESLNKIEENRDIVDPIKGLLQLALIRIEKAAIAFEMVKLESNKKSEVFYDECEVEYLEETVEEVLEVDEQENEKVEMIEAEDVEIIEAEEIPVEVIEITDDEEPEVKPQAAKPQAKTKQKSKKQKLSEQFVMTEEYQKMAEERKLQNELRKQKRIEARKTLKDCPHCDKKNFTGRQLMNHFYNNHVSHSN